MDDVPVYMLLLRTLNICINMHIQNIARVGMHYFQRVCSLQQSVYVHNANYIHGCIRMLTNTYILTTKPSALYTGCSWPHVCQRIAECETEENE
jgi:hypothetical protein